MTQNKRFAITGGIGSGKSELLKIYREFGYLTVSCDEISKELWGQADYRAKLLELFPTCEKGGEIDKSALTRLVFSDKEALARLNAFSHPIILKKVLERMNAPVSFAEVPLLFEGGYDALFDGVIAVRRDCGERIAAVGRRDGLSEEQSRARMQAQIDPASLHNKSCIIIENDGSREQLRERAVQAVRTLLGQNEESL